MLFIARSRKYFTPKRLSLAALALIVGGGWLVYAKTHTAHGPYSMADDLPRGALVYAQFHDLPAAIKRWDESSLKQQYLGSANYKQFQHRHLALKLVQRWEELNNGFGFQLSTTSISEAADAGAALAIYDIGKMDVVFVAPLSEEKLAASKFFNSKNDFEETELPDGATYYRREIEADRGRQKQVLAFAAVKGRFVLATNERLLLQTIANINGKAQKARLSDDPAFKTLSTVLTPHFATVWVDQAKLNDDWYFKHYWLMHNVDQLRGIRACIFDLEFQDGKWIERRDFLTAGKTARTNPGIPLAVAQRLRVMVPDEVPFFKIQSVTNQPARLATLVRDTLIDRQQHEQKRSRDLWSWESYDDYRFYPNADEDSSYDRYTYLNSDYESSIDDPRAARTIDREEPAGNPLHDELQTKFITGLQQSIAPAHPLAAAVATSPQTMAGPFFAEFRRVVIITLQSPGSLQRDVLEHAISHAVQGGLTVAGPGAELQWVNKNEGQQTWRELQLPLLGRKVCYALRDRELVIANSPELLAASLEERGTQVTAESPLVAALDDLTIIRLDHRKEAFDDILGKLDAEELKRLQKHTDAADSSQQFFSGNIGSLLNVAANVNRIEIKRSSYPNRLHEEIDFILQQ
jgi:hypothetical protein